LDKEIADESAMRERREQVEEENREIQRLLADLEAAHAEDAPLLQAAQDTWYKLSALQERFRSTEQLASERLRHLAATPDDERPGRDPDQLVAEAERVREQERSCARRSPTTRCGWPRRSSGGRSWNGSSRRPRARCGPAAKAIADRREGWPSSPET
jgi:chromosome segregation protein